MVPGKTFNKYGTNMIKIGPYGQSIHKSDKIAKVEFEPLNTKSSVKPELIVEFCSIYQNNHGKMTSACIKQNQSGDALNFKEEMHATGKSGHSFVYLNDKLMTARLQMRNVDGPEYSPIMFPFIYLKPIQYKHITWEELGNDARKCYFSDDQGNDLNSQSNDILQSHVFSKEQIIINDIISSNKDIILSDAFAKTFFKGLTENQLKTLANTLSNEQLQKIIPELSSNQLQVLAENLTDEQLKALVDHLTNHQLQTLAQELNPEKLQIIVPILNDAQLEALVRDLNPEQVKEILPHLKVDQFKALIKTLNDEQFTVLAKDLAEHHLTILSKELEGDQLKALVNNLQEDQLKDLVNKLDHEKLEAIAQDLTDSNRIQIIIKSLVDNPEKLQAFARNMSNKQFKELLDNVGAEELKEIIHKLPYEKVTAVIGDLSNQDQSKAIIDALKEKFDEQNKKQEEMKEKLEELKELLEGDDIVNPNQFSYQHSSVVNEEYYLNSNDAYTVQDYSISV
ncbi:mgtE intracellular N domain protein [Trichonephila clavata]|uniref:MgtE intracellular N domain protein n=2 Tax=Trichonephila clavata TaxID=2740835 RepID=A0A8X6GDX8_TRICU|nr:mgtE intracellular N domain protein [Trichonephila clavata]